MKSDQRERYTQSQLRVFLSYFKPHRKLLLLDLSSALGIALISLSFPLLTRYGLGEILPTGRYRAFALLMLLLFIGILISSFLQYIVIYWGHLLGVRMESDLRADLFAHLESLPFSFYDKTRTGHLMSRVVSDLFEITELAHHGPEDLFIAGITLIGSFIAMLMIRWELALLLLIAIPVIIFQSLRARKRMDRSAMDLKAGTAVINADLENALSGVRVAQAFTNESYEIKKFAKANQFYREAKKGLYSAMAYFQSGMELSTQLLNLIVISCGAYFVLYLDMPLTDVLTFVLYVGTFLTPIKKLISFFEQYANGMAGFRRFLELMQVESDIIDHPDAIELPHVDGTIIFRDVSFSYDNKTMVLEHVNLFVKAGQTIALVGPSGAGKSTLCQLIMRFYEIDAGEITLDGHNIQNLTLSSLRRQVGIVQQDVFLFAASIKENIRYGRIEASDEEIIAAAKRAQIHEFIMTLPDAYETEVGERGTRLSGGQKQRISLARLFLKDPPILILDEATSALDTATEVRIQQAIEELTRGKSCLIIAHRLSTVKHADEIIYIDDMGIRERGTHEELLQLDGLYKELYQAQFALQENTSLTSS